MFTADNLCKATDIYNRENNFDAVILDVILPDGNGLELMKIRKDAAIPIIILSDLGSDENIMEGFGVGAADYIVKPASMQILETRITIRLLPKKEARIERNGLTVDSNQRTASYFGKLIPLTSSEFNILFFLITHLGKFFTSDKKYMNVFGKRSDYTQ